LGEALTYHRSLGSARDDKEKGYRWILPTNFVEEPNKEKTGFLGRFYFRYVYG
jgi:hypothetical protein